jgi:hypothetical protein
MKYPTVNDYSTAIADYLVDEYGDVSKHLQISSAVKRNVVGGIVNYCYENGESVNNAANYLLQFLRSTDIELE